MNSRKTLITILICSLLLLCGCHKEQSDHFQEEFSVNGIKIRAKDGLNQWRTDTPFTNEVEKFLKKKYKEDFICEQYVYYIEFALNMKVTAYPKDKKELKFEVLFGETIGGEGDMKLLDFYYNELYKKQINQYILKSVKKYGVKEEMLQVQVYYPVTTKEITKETFKDQSVGITFRAPNSSMKKQWEKKMKEMISTIYAVIQSGKDMYFTIEYKNDRIDYDADIEGDHFRVYYGEPGEAWKIPIQ